MPQFSVSQFWRKKMETEKTPLPNCSQKQPEGGTRPASLAFAVSSGGRRLGELLLAPQLSHQELSDFGFSFFPTGSANHRSRTGFDLETRLFLGLLGLTYKPSWIQIKLGWG